MNIASHELFFVYGLIALVVVLIIIIIIIDKKENKKHSKSLYDTLNMKVIDEKDIAEYELKKEKRNNHNKSFDFFNRKPLMKMDRINAIRNIEIFNANPNTTVVKEPVNEIEIHEIRKEKEIEVKDDDLEKTQAQIRVQEIQEALTNANRNEKLEEDKYQKFEEEQEKNAIISYHELKEAYDKLYTENEKIQYVDDDKIPINIEQLYQLTEEMNQTTDKKEHKVKLDDFEELLSSPRVETEEKLPTFKSSPLISPVYGIQKSPMEEKKEADMEIQKANQFLQNLRELKNNLD